MERKFLIVFAFLGCFVLVRGSSTKCSTDVMDPLIKKCIRTLGFEDVSIDVLTERNKCTLHSLCMLPVKGISMCEEFYNKTAAKLMMHNSDFSECPQETTELCTVAVILDTNNCIEAFRGSLKPKEKVSDEYHCKLYEACMKGDFERLCQEEYRNFEPHKYDCDQFTTSPPDPNPPTVEVIEEVFNFASLKSINYLFFTFILTLCLTFIG